MKFCRAKVASEEEAGGNAEWWMNLGRTVFAQLLDYLPAYEFQKCVTRYGGGSHLRGFSRLDQLLAMAFAQLTYRESLRDIEACLRSMSGKLYHVGFRGSGARQFGRCQRGTRPAHFCGLRAGAGRNRANALESRRTQTDADGRWFSIQTPGQADTIGGNGK